MRLLLRFVLVFAAAVGLAVFAKYNPGNVVFFYPPYRIDLSLNLFLLLMALTFVALYVVMQTLRIAQGMPARVSAYRREKKDRESSRALRDALKALFEGRFGHAEKAANRATSSPDYASIAALIAARAAHWMHEYERRDVWLAAAEGDQSLRTARLMTALELLVDEHQYERAQETVSELNATGIRHIHALRLMLKANQQAGNWPEVLRLVRQLDKYSALHPALSNRLRELSYNALLADRSHDPDALRRFWNEVPVADRVNPFVAARAAQAFNQRGLHDEARHIIEKALSVEWDDRLIRAYRDSTSVEGTQALLSQIDRCEDWSKRRPVDAELALTLGTLCLKQKLWGKAQHYLEQALSNANESNTVRDAHLKLAQLHDALSQPDQAAKHYRQSALADIY